MRVLLATIALIVFCLPALAINKYNVNTMSCAEVRSILKKEGAAILRYPSKRKPGMILYDRYVRDGGLCEGGDIGQPAFVLTRDKKECRVNVCKGLARD